MYSDNQVLFQEQKGTLLKNNLFIFQTYADCRKLEMLTTAGFKAKVY